MNHEKCQLIKYNFFLYCVDDIHWLQSWFSQVWGEVEESLYQQTIRFVSLWSRIEKALQPPVCQVRTNKNCYIAANLFLTARGLIGYFEVRWHLTMKNVSRQNLWEGNTVKNQFFLRWNLTRYPCTPASLHSYTTTYHETLRSILMNVLFFSCEIESKLVVADQFSVGKLAKATGQ